MAKLKSILFLWLGLVIDPPLGAAQYSYERPYLYESIASSHGIPPRLFYALILNESRTVVNQKEKKVVLPWPWTINYKGKGYYFKTRLQAYQYIKPLIEDGESMGIGLAQIEWRWHKDKFKSIWDALEPRTNLNIAASYFREQYERTECHNWELAVGCYHRSSQSEADKVIAARYSKRVITIWDKIK